MIVNIQVVVQTYDQTSEKCTRKQEWTDIRTDRQTDGWTGGKGIRGYTLKWWSPWCYGKLVIIDTYGRMC